MESKGVGLSQVVCTFQIFTFFLHKKSNNSSKSSKKQMRGFPDEVKELSIRCSKTERTLQLTPAGKAISIYQLDSCVSVAEVQSTWPGGELSQPQEFQQR